MGVVRIPVPVKLFCALLIAPSISFDEVETTLTERFGPIDLRSISMPFSHTTYYRAEMGEGLMRLFISFDPLMARTELAAVKHVTNQLETAWTTAQGQRRVNLDPGYLDLGKVVLASTKDHAHRLYIGAGIYAEVTLRYWQKRFRAWEWTYPDYRQPETLAFFEHLRVLYRKQVSRRH